MSDILPAQHRPLRVRKVHSLRTFLWLARGWSDFMEAPLVGLLHGAVMGAFGGLLLLLAWDRFWILAGALSGFLMVAPILSTGLYAVSRALLRGEPAGFGAVWAVWSSMDRRLVKFGLLLTALGISEGDEVIVPEITWIASAAPVTYLRATPVFCDVDPVRWCLDPNSVTP